jgi:hypothetical protein
MHGTLISQHLRTTFHHCGACDAGYYLVNRVCVAWGGSCADGTMMTQAKRTTADHCGSCDAGFEITGTECSECGDGKYKGEAGAHACGACPFGQYRNEITAIYHAADKCFPWTTCVATEYESAAPTASSDRFCLPKDGKFDYPHASMSKGEDFGSARRLGLLAQQA